MNKLLIAMLSVALLLFAGYHGYNYYNGPKIVDGVVSKDIDAKGKPASITTKFSQEDTVHFSAKGNRFWIENAKVVWYKGKVATENRFLVEENVEINDAAYFTVKLSVPEGLEEGDYSAAIYVAGNDIIENHTEFTVKKIEVIPND